MILRLLLWLTRIVCAASGHPYVRHNYPCDYVECSCGRYAMTSVGVRERF